MTFTSPVSTVAGTILLLSASAIPSTTPSSVVHPAPTVASATEGTSAASAQQPPKVATASRAAAREPGRTTVLAPQTAAGAIEIVSPGGGSRSLSVRLPAALSDAAASGQTNPSDVTRYATPDQHFSAIVRTAPNGAEIRTILNDKDAPTSYSYTIAPPAGGSLTLQESGSVVIHDSLGAFAGWIDRPWARDSSGTPVATRYEVSGTTLRQMVDHRSGNYRYPITADPYLGIDLIDHIEWRQSALGRTIRVYPTAWLRLNGGSYDIGEAAWDELHEKYRTSVTKNLNGLRDQLICHVELGPIKDTYNLDEWLANVGYDATVAADCQPGKDN